MRRHKDNGLFQQYYDQAKVQVLYGIENSAFKKAAKELVACALEYADATMTTPIQVANGGIRNVTVDLVVMDEATTAVEPGLLAGWDDRESKNNELYTPLVLVGDFFQLRVTSFATKEENHFRAFRQHRHLNV